MFTPTRNTCVIEFTPPRTDSPKVEEALQTLAERFIRVMESGFVASLSDNVMGVPHFQPTDIIARLGLKPRPEQVIVHVNTFHTKMELDSTLGFCKDHGIDAILCLTGDGSELLPKLQPNDVDACGAEVVTSVELIRYIKRHYPSLACGAALNPYNDTDYELDKLKRKIDAGVDFLITQPILDRNALVDQVMVEHPQLPIIVEAWMSKNVRLLADLIGTAPKGEEWDAFGHMLKLREVYSNNGFCMSMIGFQKTYQKVEAIWKGNR